MVQQDNDSFMYVILGEGQGRCMKTRKTNRILAGGKFVDPWPIVVQVPDEEHADEVLAFAPAIRLIKAAKTTEEQVYLAWTLPGADSILAEYVKDAPGRAFYPVVYGRRSAIFLTHTDALNAIKGIEKSIWRRVATFGQAMGFMISRGESEKGVNGDYQDMRDALAARPLPSPPDVPDVPTTPQRHSTQARSSAPTPAPSGRAPETPAVPSRSQQAQDHASATLRQGRQCAYPAVFDDPVFNECAPEPSLAPSFVAHGFVYQHIRTLRGVKSTHPFPVGDVTMTPSCGAAVDALLQAFGYDVNSKLVIAHGLRTSTTMGGFVAQMSQHGLPALEAKYMWDLYSKEAQVPDWCDIHFL
ncbi:hypothetical protein OH76DRAFT_1482031 [Lentinus brumalis]|uniref:Uncharacterized protein n=1 Tax=Lentinus brumalis TaxID=2498619 RepID=A0A371DEK6_9APHY|nr:hypothetical protein OH76DRAFT_1482031 [Polyporus brumalis]